MRLPLFLPLAMALPCCLSLPILAQAPEPDAVNVRQLRDVSPGDWAFAALFELDRRYACLVGYPDGTFRGDRALARQEFAAALDACLTAIELQIGAGNLIAGRDLEMLTQLTRDFQLELALTKGRTDAVTARLQELEASQFSLTTRLRGQVVFAVSDSVGGKAIKTITRSTGELNNEPVVQHRTWIELVTSFTGRDRLRTRLAGGNPVPILVTTGETGGANSANLLFSNDGRFAIDTSLVNRNRNGVYLDLLAYDFPLGDQAQLHLFAAGGSHFDYANTINPFLDDQDGGAGAISRFGQRNPIFGIGGDGAGLGVNWRLSDSMSLDFGYIGNESGNAAQGWLQGNYALLGQITLTPTPSLQLGLTYVHAYNGTNEFRFGGLGSATGSFSANLIPLALNANAGLDLGDPRTAVPVVSQSYGVQGLWQLSERLALTGWAGFTDARLIGSGDAEIWNYAIALNFPDLGRPGNLGMILVGSEPTLKRLAFGGINVPLFDTDDTLHIEAAYRYRVSDRITVTPGLIWLPALNQDERNDEVFIFSIQSLFQF